MNTLKKNCFVPVLLSIFIVFCFCPPPLCSQVVGDPNVISIIISQLPGDNMETGNTGEKTSSITTVENPVVVSLDNQNQRVATIDMILCDEDNYLTVTGCEVTERTSGFLCRYGESDRGCSEVSLFGMNPLTPTAIAEGTGPIFVLLHEVAEDAPAGECRKLDPEEVSATDSSYKDLTVVPSGGEFCFAEAADEQDTDEDIIDDSEDNCADDDLDGVCIDTDSCPNSDLLATVVIEECNSRVINTVLENGCSMNDLVALCARKARNHGMFVFCVAHLTNQWKKEGLITGKEKGAVQSCAAQSDLP